MLVLKVVLGELLVFVFVFCINSTGYFEQIKQKLSVFASFIRKDYLIPWYISSAFENSFNVREILQLLIRTCLLTGMSKDHSGLFVCVGVYIKYLHGFRCWD
jgi:hypothetical protein